MWGREQKMHDNIEMLISMNMQIRTHEISIAVFKQSMRFLSIHASNSTISYRYCRMRGVSGHVTWKFQSFFYWHLLVLWVNSQWHTLGSQTMETPSKLESASRKASVINILSASPYYQTVLRISSPLKRRISTDNMMQKFFLSAMTIKNTEA